MSSKHREAVERRRRIILNDDAASLHLETGNTPEGFLSDPLSHTVDTQVDSVWWSFINGAEMCLYDTKVGEIAGRDPYPGALKGDLKSMAIKWGNIKSFLDAGTDPLQTVVEFCHAHDQEMFASFRMNMVQDSWRPNFTTKWKREHPEWCLGVRGMYEYSEHGDPRALFWSALDYEQQGVRDQRIAIIAEICSGYEVDGMELDFWRWPMFFKPSLDDLPVRDSHIDIMTDFMRRVRKCMSEIEAGRERPLLLAPRVFETVEGNLRLGLDVETWLKEGLIDLLVVGGTYHEHAIPVADWAELSHKYDVPLYPCLYRSHGIERDRAAAAYFFSSGADGIYTFNLRVPEGSASIAEIGDPDLIARRDKHYVLPGPVTDATSSYGRACAPSPLPVQLEQDKPQSVPVLIGDDLQQAAADDSLAQVDLYLSVKNFVPGESEVMFRVNGRMLKSPRLEKQEDGWRLQFRIYTVYTDIRREPPLRLGRNTIEATLQRQSSRLTGPVELVGVEVSIEYQ